MKCHPHGRPAFTKLLLFLFTQVPRQERDAPTVEDWETFGRRGRAVQETTARTSFYKTNSSPDLDGRLVEKRKKPVPEGPAQTMASPQAIAAFRVQALERSRFAVGRLPAAYGDWSARSLACRSEVNGVRWVWNWLAELTTRLVSALRPSSAVARGDRATVRTRDFPSSPPMGESFWLGL